MSSGSLFLLHYFWSTISGLLFLFCFQFIISGPPFLVHYSWSIISGPLFLVEEFRFIVPALVSCFTSAGPLLMLHCVCPLLLAHDVCIQPWRHMVCRQSVLQLACLGRGDMRDSRGRIPDRKATTSWISTLDPADKPFWSA